jgi:hypothetical protein
MIIDTKGMRQIEEDSQIPVSDLMFTAGSAARVFDSWKK